MEEDQGCVLSDQWDSDSHLPQGLWTYMEKLALGKTPEADLPREESEQDEKNEAEPLDKAEEVNEDLPSMPSSPISEMPPPSAASVDTSQSSSADELDCSGGDCPDVDWTENPLSWSQPQPQDPGEEGDVNPMPEFLYVTGPCAPSLDQRNGSHQEYDLLSPSREESETYSMGTDTSALEQRACDREMQLGTSLRIEGCHGLDEKWPVDAGAGIAVNTECCVASPSIEGQSTSPDRGSEPESAATDCCSDPLSGTEKTWASDIREPFKEPGTPVFPVVTCYADRGGHPNDPDTLLRGGGDTNPVIPEVLHTQRTAEEEQEEEDEEEEEEQEEVEGEDVAASMGYAEKENENEEASNMDLSHIHSQRQREQQALTMEKEDQLESSELAMELDQIELPEHLEQSDELTQMTQLEQVGLSEQLIKTEWSKEKERVKQPGSHQKPEQPEQVDHLEEQAEPLDRLKEMEQPEQPEQPKQLRPPLLTKEEAVTEESKLIQQPERTEQSEDTEESEPLEQMELSEQECGMKQTESPPWGPKEGANDQGQIEQASPPPPPEQIGEQTEPLEPVVPRVNGGCVNRDQARRLAEKLYRLDNMLRTDVVKHIDKDNDFSRAVGEEYLKFFDFSGLSLDQSLRSFLKVVVLIGETQERERVLEHFACRFHECNPDSFSKGAALTLTCAVMLLNSDLHGQNVGKAMSLAGFVTNLDGMNDGVNFRRELLKSLYNTIKNEPLEWAVGEEELKSSMVLPGDEKADASLRSKSNPFQDVPHDKKATVYKQGFLTRKAHADIDGKRTPWGKRSWKTFCAVLRGMVLYLQKDEYRMEWLSSEEVVSVHHALAEKAGDYTKRPHVFRLQTADWRVFLFQAPTAEQMNSWVSRINLVSALYSSPPFPAAVGSQKRFSRPILPATQSAIILEKQLQSHSRMLASFSEDLAQLQQSPLEGRKAKARNMEDHRQREEYLHHEKSRYEVYIQMLEVWKNLDLDVTGKVEASSLERFDGAVHALMGDEEEMEGAGLKKSHSSPSINLEPAMQPVVKVKRNISERRTYRKIIIPRHKEL